MSLETIRVLLWAGVAAGTIFAVACGFFANVVSQKITERTDQMAIQAAAKQNRQWAPARRAVLTAVGATYSSLFYAARAVASPEDGIFATDTPSSTHYQAVGVLLARSEDSINKLHELIKLNNTALDSELLPQVTVLAQTAEKLQALLAYFAQFQNAKWVRYDFVSEAPDALLQQLTGSVDEMHKLYPDTLIRGKDVAGNLMSPTELRALWANLDKTCRRISFHPKNYVWHDTTPVAVFNPANLRELAVPGKAYSQNGVYVFFGYQ